MKEKKNYAQEKNKNEHNPFSLSLLKITELLIWHCIEYSSFEHHQFQILWKMWSLAYLSVLEIASHKAHILKNLSWTWRWGMTKLTDSHNSAMEYFIQLAVRNAVVFFVREDMDHRMQARIYNFYIENLSRRTMRLSLSLWDLTSIFAITHFSLHKS